MAADNYFGDQIDGTRTHVNSLARIAINDLQRAVDELTQLNNVMAQVMLDNNLVAQLGFTGTNASDDATRLKSLVNSVISDSFVQQLLSNCS